MAKSYALAFPCKFILQCSDLLLHAIQAELSGFIRGAQTLGTFEPIPREYESKQDISFVHKPCYSTTKGQMLSKKVQQYLNLSQMSTSFGPGMSRL
jgi:hypothetical protein